jgi:beta-lactamase regulating signal transducer with metallopeptidase domain
MSWLNALLQGTIVTMAAAALLRLVRTNAATRYWTYLAALAAVVGLQVRALLPAEAAPAPEFPVVAVPVPASSGDWFVWAGAVWVAISSALLIRLALSYRSARRLKAAASPATSRVCRAVESAGVRRRVRVLISPAGRAPLSLGFTDPAILIPAHHLDELSDAELDHVVLHELAHLERRDDWTKLAQKLVQALLFFHPAVLWLGRHLDLEREIACDDWVVAVTGERRAYASCLARLAEITTPSYSPAAALGSGFTTRQLSRRIEMLLDKGRNRTRGVSSLALLAALLLLLTGLAVVGRFRPLAAAPPPQAADESRLEARLRELQERIERVYEEKLQLMEARVRELEERLRAKERKLRELEHSPEVEAMHQKAEALVQERLRAKMEPKLRELEERARKVQREAIRRYEEQQRELQKKLEQKVKELESHALI